MSTISKGTLLSFSGGEYSDKWNFGPFEVLKDFDQKEVSDLFVSEFVPEYEWDKPSEHSFVAWLSANQFIQDVPQSLDWYLGGYGFEPEIGA